MNIKRFDLNLLVTFDVLMRERSVSRAAAELALTQPAVSNALNRLRLVLDDPLLVRTRAGMEPTERALELIAPVQNALRELDSCLTAKPRFNPAEGRQRFVIGASDYVALMLLPALLQRINALAPSVEVQIKNLGPDNPEVELETGRFDFALGRFFQVSNRLVSQVWSEEPMVCLVRENHPQVKQRLSLKQYLRLEHARVSINNDRVGKTDQWLKDHGNQRKVTAIIPNYTTAAMVVAETDLALVVPKRLALRVCQLLPLKSVPLPIELGNFTVEMLWHPRHASSPAHNWFREQLLAVAECID